VFVETPPIGGLAAAGAELLRPPATAAEVAGDETVAAGLLTAPGPPTAWLAETAPRTGAPTPLVVGADTPAATGAPVVAGAFSAALIASCPPPRFGGWIAALTETVVAAEAFVAAALAAAEAEIVATAPPPTRTAA
jgi:hypothetical protein